MEVPQLCVQLQKSEQTEVPQVPVEGVSPIPAACLAGDSKAERLTEDILTINS